MSEAFSAPLVGMHFRPPAKAILQALPAAHPLELRPEPSNPYDPNAVAVWFDASTLSQDAIEELSRTLPPMGCDIESLQAQRFWHIGYIAREHAEIHHSTISARIEGHNIESDASSQDPIWTGYPCTLAFDGAGKSRVAFRL